MRAVGMAMVMIVVLISSSAPVFASDGGPEIIAELVVRPLGLAAIVVGSAAFIVALPFAAATGDVNLVARKLVAEPFRYTFVRPFGDFDENWDQSNAPNPEP